MHTSYWIRRHLQLKLVRKLEYRFRLVSAANALAIFHDGHHRDPGALARWYIMMPSRPEKSRASAADGETIPAAKVSCGLVSFGKVMWFDEETYSITGLPDGLPFGNHNVLHL